MRRLLIRPGAIGDFIVSLPALESLRAAYTEVWCRSEVVPLVQFADRTLSIVASGIGRLAITQAHDVMTLLGEFDEIHSWYGTNRPEFREECRTLPFHYYPALPVGGTQHAVDFYLTQVGQPAGGTPRVRIRSQPKEQFAVLHPFSGSVRKNWPMHQWQRLAGILEQRMPVVWCRGPEDTLPGAALIPNLLELAQWLSSARVYIGNDSGVSHLAAAAGTSTKVIFCETNPAVWGPRGRDVTVFPGHVTAREIAEAVL